MTNKSPLKPGDIVQYRKVGTARLVEREGPVGYPEYDATGEGRWTLEWIKAPKRYRETPDLSYGFWVSLSDRIEVAS